MRIRQWYKNLLVFTPLVFANLLGHPDKIFAGILAFCAFCAISSCTYIFNDIHDASADAYHPVKKNRPIVTGKVTKRAAIVLAFVLAGFVITLCLFLPIPFSLNILCYFLLNIAYSLYLKHLFIIDVMVIGVSFILRVLGGSESVDVHLSSWLFIATFVLALLLGFSKRSAEISSMENAENHRSVLVEYDPLLIRSFILISGITALIVYLIYAITIIKNQYFVLTTPFVFYGLFLFLSFTIHTGCDPDDIFRNRAFVANLVLWLLMVVTTLYVL